MDFGQICKDVLDIDESIRFSMIVVDGVKKFGGYRYSTVGIFDSEELNKSVWYAHQRSLFSKSTLSF